MSEENLLREVVGDYKNEKKSKKNLNEEYVNPLDSMPIATDDTELLNDWNST